VEGSVVSAVVFRRAAPLMGGVLAALAVSGCFDVESVDPGPKPRRVARVDPDGNGWVAPGSNPLGISGFWFSYGDQYDEPKRCTGPYGMHPPDNGMHGDTECSFVAYPDATPRLGFANVGGRMCTAGNGAKVVPCPVGDDTCQDNYDYSGMWGTGIGLDLGLPAGNDGGAPVSRDVTQRTTWNAIQHGTTGVSFDFTWIDKALFEEPAVRVGFSVTLPEPDGLKIHRNAVTRDGEFYPASDDTAGMLPAGEGLTSEDHPSGSPFADAPSSKTWGAHDVSDIHEGHNEIPWSRIHAPPLTDYDFDPATSEILGIQIQVPTVKESRLPYAFCVENLAFTLD
jgi:hypothetical protein